MNRTVTIGSDHAGYQYKEILKTVLSEQGWQVTDKGTSSEESTDYPDYAHAVATAITAGDSAYGILVCGSGNGVCMTANKHAGIRAALCWTEELAALARQHNNANILCIPGRFVSEGVAQEMAHTFLQTPFEGGRHEKRAAKIDKTP